MPTEMLLPRLSELTKAQVRDAQSIDFIRYLSCLAETRGARTAAADMYLARYGDSFGASAVRKSLESTDMLLKAAVAPGTSTDATWAGPLAGIQQLAAGFLQVAHSASLLGRIPGLQLVPARTKI